MKTLQVSSLQLGQNDLNSKVILLAGQTSYTLLIWKPFDLEQFKGGLNCEVAVLLR